MYVYAQQVHRFPFSVVFIIFVVVGLVEGTNSFQFVQSQVALKIRFIIFRVERLLDKKVGISSGVFIERWKQEKKLCT